MEDRSLRVRVVGPLEPFAQGFRAELADRGYTPWSAKPQLHLVAHLSRWLASQGLEAGELVPERVEQFLTARRAAGYPKGPRQFVWRRYQRACPSRSGVACKYQ